MYRYETDSLIWRMDQPKKYKLPPVFSRLSEDIVNWTNKKETQRVTGTGFSKERMRTDKSNEGTLNVLSTSKSYLGKAILYGNKSYQRHLDLKIADIEKQRIQRMRSMEWIQLNEFRQLARDRRNRHKCQKRVFGKCDQPRGQTRDQDTSLKVHQHYKGDSKKSACSNNDNSKRISTITLPKID